MAGDANEAEQRLKSIPAGRMTTFSLAGVTPGLCASPVRIIEGTIRLKAYLRKVYQNWSNMSQ